MFKSRCYNGGQRHKFKPRYSEVKSAPTVEIQEASGSKIAMDSALNILEASRKITTTYHHDVCEWCGKVSKQ
jgi:NADH:ubiquinone oxidoreductase subunit F (NADH-binding)